MEEQSVRIVNTFNIGIFLRIKILVHKLQHIFHTNLLGISYRPDRIELQSFCHRTFKNKDRRSTGAGDQIDSF